MRCPVSLVVTFGLFAHAAAQEPAIEPDPKLYEWSIETYAFPAWELTTGFTSRERGELQVEELPGQEASEEEVDAWIQRNSSIIAHYFEGLGVPIPEGSLFAFDRESLTLAARLPGLTHWSLASLADQQQQDYSLYVAMDFVILEGSQAQGIELVEAAPLALDHADLLASWEDAQGVNEVVRLRGDARSGQRFTAKEVTEVLHAADMETAEEGYLSFSADSLSVGTIWEVDPVIAADGETIDVNVSVEHDYEPLRRESRDGIGLPGKVIRTRVFERTVARLANMVLLRDGRTKLLTVWMVGDGRSRAVFLTTDLVRLLPLPNDRVTEILTQRSDAILPIPEGRPNFVNELVEGVPEGMFVQRFRVPPSLLSSGVDGNGAVSADPFADSGAPATPRFTMRATVKEILQAVGIEFPEGSSASYVSGTSELIIRNTPENLQLVEAYVGSLVEDVLKTIPLVAYVVEGPTALIRQTARDMRKWPDHSWGWKALRENPEAQVIDATILDSRSGQRAKTMAIREYCHIQGADAIRWPSGTEEEEKIPQDRVITLDRGVQNIGTEFEVDPVIGADGVTIDLNLSYQRDYGEPVLVGGAELNDKSITMDAALPEFHEASVISAISMRSGAIRMVGIWKPLSPEFEEKDVMQALFVQAFVQKIDEEE